MALGAAAGLTPIFFTDDLNLSASWGGLVLAMNDTLTHYPAQPEGMSNEDFQKGYDATTRSNISFSDGSLGAPMSLVSNI